MLLKGIQKGSMGSFKTSEVGSKGI